MSKQDSIPTQRFANGQGFHPLNLDSSEDIFTTVLLIIRVSTQSSTNIQSTLSFEAIGRYAKVPGTS